MTLKDVVKLPKKSEALSRLRWRVRMPNDFLDQFGPRIVIVDRHGLLTETEYSNSEKPRLVPAMLTVEDICADDWEVVENWEIKK